MKRYKYIREDFMNLQIGKKYIMSMNVGILRGKSPESLVFESLDGTEEWTVDASKFLYEGKLVHYVEFNGFKFGK